MFLITFFNTLRLSIASSYIAVLVVAQTSLQIRHLLIFLFTSLKNHLIELRMSASQRRKNEWLAYVM